MKSSADHVKLSSASLDALFTTEESRLDAQREHVQELPLDQLHPFLNHPFKVQDDDEMEKMIESIKEYGVLTPAVARPAGDVGYELISGHRRHRACELLGLESMPVILRELDDDEAAIIMVDSNLQRERLLPSELAFAYKIKLEAMNRQGARTDLTSSQLGTKLRTDEILAQQICVSRNQIQRYIRLTELISPLLDMVDKKKLAIAPAYELSFLHREAQELVLSVIRGEAELISVSVSQAKQLRQISEAGQLTCADIKNTLVKTQDALKKVTFTPKSLSKYFPSGTTDVQMREKIIELLEAWKMSGN